MNITQEHGLSVVKNSFIEWDDNTALAAGKGVGVALGNRAPSVAVQISEILSAHPETMLPVAPIDIFTSMEAGETAIVLGLDDRGEPNGPVYGFSRYKPYVSEEGREQIDDLSTGLVLPGSFEAGSLLGNGTAAPGRAKDVPPGQGSRAMRALVQVGKARHPEASFLAITKGRIDQEKTRAAKALERAGGVLVGTKLTDRLQGTNVPVLLYHMDPAPKNGAVVRRGR